MINSVRTYNLINSYPKALSFNGYNYKTCNVKSENKLNWLLNQTLFFRNIETLEFAQKYITNNFPNGTHIADFGCSNGEEAYSLMMLLNKQNKDKKYTITGYDLSPKVIELAQSGPFEIINDYNEGYIKSTREHKYIDKRYLKGLFRDCFEDVPEKFITNRGWYGDESIINSKIKQETDAKKLLRLKCFREIVRRPNNFELGNTYVPKQEFVEDVVDFKLGDVNKLSKIIKSDGKTGVIIFKNAWYHVSGAYYEFNIKKLNMAGVEKIIKAAHNTLPEKGLFVVGNLENDHLYSEQKSHFKIQDHKRILVCDETPLAELLRQNGFKPIFYEQVKDKYGAENKNGIYLPSVWQKI